MNNCCLVLGSLVVLVGVLMLVCCGYVVVVFVVFLSVDECVVYVFNCLGYGLGLVDVVVIVEQGVECWLECYLVEQLELCCLVLFVVLIECLVDLDVFRFGQVELLGCYCEVVKLICEVCCEKVQGMMFEVDVLNVVCEWVCFFVVQFVIVWLVWVL